MTISEKAILIAVKAHEGQVDLDGKPVILHPLSVGLMGDNEEQITVGFLHDVVEDSDMTLEDIRKAGFNESILDSLALLTHSHNEPYDEYIERIISSGNLTAIHVKLNDLVSNISRNDRKTPVKERIYQKHKKAFEKILKAV